MSQINIEFFHDVICSFCYPMSYKMRELQKKMPELNITHRSFALIQDKNAFKQIYGSDKQAKDEIVSHWSQANRLDTERRFNIDGMKNTDFPLPSSMKPLTASKAGYYIGGEQTYWDIFDALQKAFFTDSKNIGDDEVIFDIMRDLDIDFDEWKKAYKDSKTLKAVKEDIKLAEQYGVDSVPALIINEKYKLNGVLEIPELIKIFNEIMAEE